MQCNIIGTKLEQNWNKASKMAEDVPSHLDESVSDDNSIISFNNVNDGQNNVSNISIDAEEEISIEITDDTVKNKTIIDDHNGCDEEDVCKTETLVAMEVITISEDNNECEENMDKTNENKCETCNTGEMEAECFHCSKQSCWTCAGLETVHVEEHHGIVKQQKDRNDGLCWLCQECYDIIGKSSKTIKQLILEDEKKQIVHDEEIRMTCAQVRSQDDQIQSMLEEKAVLEDRLCTLQDEYKQKQNQFSTEAAILNDKLDEKDRTIQEQAKKMQLVKQEKATEQKALIKIRKDLQGYKELYEDKTAELQQSKRTINNLNTAIERLFVSPRNQPHSIQSAPKHATAETSTVTGPSTLPYLTHR